MALPANLSIVKVKGTYLNIVGQPIAGQIKFTPRAVLRNVSADLIIINSTITVTLDSNGYFEQDLVATNDTDAAPVNFTYRVEEAFIGGRTYDMLIPQETVGGVLDLADVSPAVPNDGSGSLYVSVSQYISVDARVTAIEALASIFGDLYDALGVAIANSTESTNLFRALVPAVNNAVDSASAGANNLLLTARA